MQDLSTRKRRASVSYQGLLLALGSLFILFIGFLFDYGPVLPPFGKSFSTIDCYAVKLINVSDDYGRLTIGFNTTEAVEYPPEYLPHFLRIEIESSVGKCTYKSKEVANLTKSEDSITLSLFHGVSDESRVKAYCLGNPVGEKEVFLRPALNRSVRTTTIDKIPHAGLSIGDVCHSEGHFILFSNSEETRIYDFDIGGTNHSIYPLSTNLDDFIRFKNITVVNTTSVILNQIDFTPWKMILFALTPLSNILGSNIDTLGKKPQFLFTDQVPKGALDALKRFTNVHPTKMKDEQCYKSLLVPSTKVGIDIHNNDQIQDALESNFSALRKIIVKSEVEDKKILVTPHLSYLQDSILEVCPECNVSVIYNKPDINLFADIVHSGTILIGNHFTNLINMVWLEPGASGVIDLSSSEMLCNKWAFKLSQKLNITYNSLEDEVPECKCSDFSCYPESMQTEKVELEHFQEILKKTIVDLQKKSKFVNFTLQK